MTDRYERPTHVRPISVREMREMRRMQKRLAKLPVPTAEDNERLTKWWEEYRKAEEQKRMANTVREHYDSVEEFCTAPFVLPENEARCRRSMQKADNSWVADEGSGSPFGRDDWYGPDKCSAAVAANRALTGWPEGAKQALERLSHIQVQTPVSVKRRAVRADQGDELDIHAVYRGDLDHAWTTRRRRNARGPRIVRIIAQFNLTGRVAAESLFWRGAAVIKLADILTEAGYNVEITAAMASIEVDQTSANWLITFPLKLAQSPLDVDALAGVVCNAGFHRTYGFRAYLARWPKVRNNNAGSDHSDEGGKVIPASDIGQDNAVRTFTVPYNVTNVHSAQEWLEKCAGEL
jgi:hypothetical protein